MTWAGRGRVAFVGVGFSPIERDSEVPLLRHAELAIANAITDAGLRPSDIDGLATFPSPAYRRAPQREGIDVIGVESVLSHSLPGAVRWYAELNSGLVIAAIVEAALALIAGACSHVLIWRALGHPKGGTQGVAPPDAGGSAAFSAPWGCATALQWHALAWRRYLMRYGQPRDKMAALAITQRRHAALNPNAYFQNRPMTESDYLGSRMVADPMCLLDCDIPVHGCVAMVMTTADRARDLRHRPAFLSGFSMSAAPRPPLLDYTLLDHLEAGRPVARELWDSAGVAPNEIGAAMLYDGFSPAVIYWLEAAGFCGPGEALQFIQEGRIAIDGALPVNTFGGSLSQGRFHGMGHAAEAVLQASGRAGERQVSRADAVCVFSGSPMYRGTGIVVTREP